MPCRSRVQNNNNNKCKIEINFFPLYIVKTKSGIQLWWYIEFCSWLPFSQNAMSNIWNCIITLWHTIKKSKRAHSHTKLTRSLALTLPFFRSFTRSYFALVDGLNPSHSDTFSNLTTAYQILRNARFQFQTWTTMEEICITSPVHTALHCIALRSHMCMATRTQNQQWEQQKALRSNDRVRSNSNFRRIIVRLVLCCLFCYSVVIPLNFCTRSLTIPFRMGLRKESILLLQFVYENTFKWICMSMTVSASLFHPIQSNEMAIDLLRFAICNTF